MRVPLQVRVSLWCKMGEVPAGDGFHISCFKFDVKIFNFKNKLVWNIFIKFHVKLISVYLSFFPNISIKITNWLFLVQNYFYTYFYQMCDLKAHLFIKNLNEIRFHFHSIFLSSKCSRLILVIFFANSSVKWAHFL